MADADDAPDVVRFPEYDTVDRTILLHHDELIARYHAHHIGVSKKHTGGKRLPETSITFYVMRKGDDHAGERIPPYLDLVYADGTRPRRIATDVCALIEEPVALGIRGGNVVMSADNEQGTVGLVLRRDGKDFLVTNAHVVTDPGQPAGLVLVGLPNGGGSFQGVVSRIDDLNAPLIRSDAALIEVAAGAVESGKFRGTELVLSGYDEIGKNDPRQFFFVSKEFVHQVAWSGWVAAPAPITVDGQPRHYAGFHTFRVVRGQASPGNSGAVVFCRSANGLTAVGLLFGGALAINEVWVFPIRSSLAQLGILV